VDELREHIHKLREDFSRGSLSEHDVHKDPAEQFRHWMSQAVEARVPEVQAMNLSTVSSAGQPSSRIVYLREFGEHEFCFYTNFNSRKAKDLEQNPRAAITFFWPQLERQIRIEGMVKKAANAQSDAYYNLRPYDSKLGAWASSQSGAIGSREELERKVEEFRKQFPPDKIKRPEHWGGYVVIAEYYEFWQGRKSRLHDRISYSLHRSEWRIGRLAP
jgi:pyridoxamine 5'-phosphate oxidase